MRDRSCRRRLALLQIDCSAHSCIAISRCFSIRCPTYAPARARRDVQSRENGRRSPNRQSACQLPPDDHNTTETTHGPTTPRDVQNEQDVSDNGGSRHAVNQLHLCGTRPNGKQISDALDGTRTRAHSDERNARSTCTTQGSSNEMRASRSGCMARTAQPECARRQAPFAAA